ncbi:MAG: hypothetical protein ACK56I_36380, partial [bacterium]
MDLPDEVFLAVNPRGVLIINPDTKDVLSEYPYSEVGRVRFHSVLFGASGLLVLVQIPTWGHSGSSFVLHIGNLLKQTKLYFQVCYRVVFLKNTFFRV